MRWLVILAGTVGVVLIVGGIATSYAGHPGFSPLRQFISELASPINPAASRLNLGFIAGGACVAAFLVTVAVATSKAMRWSAGFGAVAAFSLIFVGVYPLTNPGPHVTAAATAVACSTTASILLAITMRTALVRSLVALQGLLLVSCIGFVAYVVATSEVAAGSVLIGSAVRVGETNPIAIAEWVYFSTVLGLLSVVIANAVARLRSPVLAPTPG